MRIATYVFLIVAAVSLLVALVVRAAVGAGLPTASAFLRFTDTCLLAAIALILLQMVRAKGQQSGEGQ